MTVVLIMVSYLVYDTKWRKRSSARVKFRPLIQEEEEEEDEEEEDVLDVSKLTSYRR